MRFTPQEVMTMVDGGTVCRQNFEGEAQHEVGETMYEYEIFDGQLMECHCGTTKGSFFTKWEPLA